MHGANKCVDVYKENNKLHVHIHAYRITGYFCGPEIFAFCSKTLNLIFCEFNFMRLIGAAK